MLDRLARNLLDPVLLRLAKVLKKIHLNANQLSLLGFLLNLPLLIALSRGDFYWAMVFILLNRLTDGLDGLLARLSGKKNALGGFIDISNDYVFYGLVPVGFALFAPDQNAMASTILLFGFLMTAVSFLAAATVHEKLASKKNSFQASKGFFYSFGIMEGTETIGFFLLACALPQYYSIMALLAAGVCALTALARFIGLARLVR
ncbi:MAG: CDP-alcohol phosphatidyltransferase family protein [Hydrotalea sp.]|nr:CDP-alcohol phosphatidyltransferase family protein [Hydrotalea sp.]